MKSECLCPSCKQPLTKEEHPPRSKSTPRPYVQLFCENPRCPSDAARNDGGSADTEMRAYVALLNTVDHETEQECAEVVQDRNADAMAERANDQRGCL